RFSDVAGLCGALHPDRSENMECCLSAARPVHDRMELACIAHKSSEICERCRLRQQNPPATPDNSAAFWEEEFKNRLFRITNFKKQALRQTPSVCLSLSSP